uniref:Aminotransferase-like protein n=1 Tax=Oryza sativa subsp. japonica TaxID=39947 RepID=Q6Z5Z0_ORYSJ|nr:aminotransferase-like protein [Oryza sativa Japonica Group]
MVTSGFQEKERHSGGRSDVARVYRLDSDGAVRVSTSTQWRGGAKRAASPEHVSAADEMDGADVGPHVDIETEEAYEMDDLIHGEGCKGMATELNMVRDVHRCVAWDASRCTALECDAARCTEGGGAARHGVAWRPGAPALPGSALCRAGGGHAQPIGFARRGGEVDLGCRRDGLAGCYTDDLPTIDPDVEEYLENEEMEEAIDDAVADVLADMFSFDSNQFMDEEREEATSKALVPINDDIKAKLVDIAHRLRNSLDSLVIDCGPIRARFEEIHSQIPEALADIISPVVYLEQHRFKLEWARQRIADRRERTKLKVMIQANRLSIKEEKTKLDEMEAGPSSTQANRDRLRTREAELVAELEKCRADISSEEQKLVDLPNAIEEQRSKLKRSIKHLSDLSHPDFHFYDL